MTPYELWQMERYGNYIPEKEVDEGYWDRTEDVEAEILSSDIHDELNPITDQKFD